MGTASEWRRVIKGIIAGLLYGVLLAFLSFMAVGPEGRGTGIPFLMSSAPFGLLGMFGGAAWGAPLLWAIVGALVTDPGRLVPPGAVLLVHYASGILLAMVYLTSLERDGDDVVQFSPEVIFIWAAVYLIGQAVVWRRIFK
jgi:hypothetical protein